MIVCALVGRELKVEFPFTPLVLHQIILNPLGRLLGEKEVVVAENNVDDLLAFHRLTEIVDDVLDHHERLSRLLRLADETEANPFIFIVDMSHHLALADLAVNVLSRVILVSV